MKTYLFVLTTLIVLSVWATRCHAADPTGQYAQSPNAAWYGAQVNKRGGYCCSQSDGEAYYGDYSFNPDGSVTLHSALGDVLVEEWKVLTGKNPVGHPILWHNGATIYCFSPGAGI